MNPRATREVRPRRPVRRAATLAIVALAVFTAVVLFLSNRRVASPARHSVSSDERESTGVPSVPLPPAPAKVPTRAGLPAAHPADPPPIIDAISVEKPEVCSGEENLITVRAHTSNGTDAFLHTVVDGAMGASVPVRLWLDENGRVRLPDSLIAYAHLGENITFVGLGEKFEIWDTLRLNAYREERRASASNPKTPAAR